MTDFRSAPTTNFNQTALNLAGPQIRSRPRQGVPQVNGVTGFQPGIPGTRENTIIGQHFAPLNPVTQQQAQPRYFNLQDFLSQLNGPGFNIGMFR